MRLTLPVLFTLGLSLLGCAGSEPAADDTAVDGVFLIEVDPGFGEEMTSGVAEGDASEAPCEGAFPAEPQHRITVSAPLYAASIHLDSADALLWVTFENSDFCSDTETGVSAIERGSWSAGDYDVYVGVPAAGETVPYTLTFEEQ